MPLLAYLRPRLPPNPSYVEFDYDDGPGGATVIYDFTAMRVEQWSIVPGVREPDSTSEEGQFRRRDDGVWERQLLPDARALRYELQAEPDGESLTPPSRVEWQECPRHQQERIEAAWRKFLQS
jgi:hypothetical protein